MVASDEGLPELLYDDLAVGRTFPEMSFELSEEVVAAYMAAVGDANPLYVAEPVEGSGSAIAPPGLWGVWGRRSYLANARMPPGGVLAGLEMVFEAPVYVGDVLTAQAKVADRWEKGERRFVTIETEARDGNGDVCGLVRVTAIWPK